MVKKSDPEKITAPGAVVPKIGLPSHPGFIKFPRGCNIPKERNAFLYRLQERLRLEHNDMGMQLRNKIISRQEWDDFLRSWNEKSDNVVSEILAARAELKADDSWDESVNTAFGP